MIDLSQPGSPRRRNQAVDIAAGLGDKVVVVGLSGGGAVAAYLARFQTAPDATGEGRLSASLGLPHDLIGPDRADKQTDVTFPVLLDLIERP